MSTSADSASSKENPRFPDRSALVVGVGGLGCPAALALVRAGVGRVVLVDDDLVEEANLHRQILYRPQHVGRDKLDSALEALRPERGPEQRIDVVRTRLLPDNARELVRSVDVVVEGSDNFATKFLTADACGLERRAVVHGAAVRWRGTAWAVEKCGGPCYRCLFEDLPSEDAGLNCAQAGVMGPVVGVVGALMADLALGLLAGDASATGAIHTYDGLADRLRRVAVARRPSCPLCGVERSIREIIEARYVGDSCAA